MVEISQHTAWHWAIKRWQCLATFIASPSQTAFLSGPPFSIHASTSTSTVQAVKWEFKCLSSAFFQCYLHRFPSLSSSCKESDGRSNSSVVDTQTTLITKSFNWFTYPPLNNSCLFSRLRLNYSLPILWFPHLQWKHFCILSPKIHKSPFNELWASFTSRYFWQGGLRYVA